MYHHGQHCIATQGPRPSPKPTDSFTLFPLLPAELRLKVWELAAREPQTVELSCTPTSSYLPKGRWFSHNKPPIVLSVCSESREVALREYSVLKFCPDQIGNPWPRLYINFEVDTLWLCSDLCQLWARDLLEKNEQLKTSLRSLVVNENLWKQLNHTMLTPGISVMALSGTGLGGEPQEAVVGYLKALENLRFSG